MIYHGTRYKMYKTYTKNTDNSKNIDNSDKSDMKNNSDPIKSLDRIIENLKVLYKYVERHGHL